ncbi:hypothetical protein VE03_06895 [Pseudogymnoascus sp. 23342-1-I1]|nr:hypothetical protein VE03_06895 [Pseudogymnoascus sp. 23342-1-I1]
MASSDYPWLQLPTWTQWEELAFDNSYNSQGDSLLSPSFDNNLFTNSLTTPPPSLNTTPPSPNDPMTQTPNPQHPSHRRQRRTVQPPRSESSTTGSTSQDNSHGPISQRRKCQNRASQRAFRQRRTERLQTLQSRVTYLEKQLDAAKVVNQLLAQMSGLRSLEELRGRGGGGGAIVRSGREGETDEMAREPPACEEGAGFQTFDLPLLGMGVGEEYWDAPVLGEGLEGGGGDWQAVAMGGGSLSEASPFGRVPDGAGWA